MFGDFAKYIIVRGKYPISRDTEIAIVFSPLLVHAEMARTREVISAGFVDCNFNCFGKSISLGIASRPEKDSEIIMNAFGTDAKEMRRMRRIN